MSSALGSLAPAPPDNEPPLEVEEAELSSDSEHVPSHSKSPSRTSPQDDFVLDDEVDDDDDDLVDNLDHPPASPSADTSRQPHPTSHHTTSPQHYSDLHPSSASAPGAADNPKPNGTSSPHSRPSTPASSDDSEYSSASSDQDDDRDADHIPEEDDDDDSPDEQQDEYASKGKGGLTSNIDDADVNGHGGSDSDESSTLPRRSTQRRGRKPEKLVIPDELKDDDNYFRRSHRARNAPDRYSESPPGTPSSVGSDSDFIADSGAGPYEDEDDDLDGEDDDDYMAKPRRKSRGSGTRRSGRREANEGLLADDTEEIVLEDDDFESGSDGDWREDSKKKLLGRRRRKKKKGHGPAKRQRTMRAEDDDAAPSARINSRTGGAVNYFESDDDFVDSDEQPVAPGGGESAVDDGSPRIDMIFDYRPIGHDGPPEEGVPFSDFHRDKVEFRVKWLNKSFRKNTWETWDTLKDMKGHKRVRNYIKLVEERAAQFRLRTHSLEEIAEVRLIRAEHRASVKASEVIDRVIAQRETESEPSQTEYLVKWMNLPYSECTWEPRAELMSEADIKSIDEYTDREQSVLATTGKNRLNPFNQKEERPRFKRMLEQPGYLGGEGRTLRDYQLAGLNFLAFSWTKRHNVILADEMGLGKTLQTISFLGWLMYCRNVHGPFLVVVPLSTISAWVREFARWLPDMNVVCYNGDGKSREVIRKHEFLSSNKSALKFHVLLTTPELLMVDQDFLNETRWAAIAVDEAHRLKNETSALHLTLASLRSADRLLITGTPLQNSVRELWALLHFLNPAVFDDPEKFEESFSFSALRDPERVSSLHQTLRPYIIRRQKTDVEKSLPNKTYAVLRVGMTSSQQQYYRWLLTKNFAKLNAGSKSRGIGTHTTLRNLVMELKKCCNHPYLFPNYEDLSRDTPVEDLIRASGKLILLDKLLLRLREKGHRVLIFSQMVRMLDILQDYCRMRQFLFQRLDGSVSNDFRQRAVDHFNAPDSNDFVFLLSTRAGGLGINLATADTVIIFDSDWNPQNDLQAESRAHRIGQTKDVKVFRLLSRETVEEDILERAKRKRVLEHLVIHGVEGGDQSDGKDAQTTFKKEELSAILRFGAEKLFENDRKGQLNPDGQEQPSTDGKGENASPLAVPPAENEADKERDEKAEERRVLEVDDIDELLARAPTDDASQVGAAQPSIGDSLLNAFKWADFKTVEEEEAEEEGAAYDNMAKDAANRLIAIDKEASKAKVEEVRQQEEAAKEGDNEFWARVIPGELKEEAIANEVVLGTRRRKRTKTFSSESPRDGKRRRVTRGARGVGLKVSDVDELSAKEQRSLLRSLRKFGDPRLVGVILKDSGLHERVEEELGTVLFLDCIEQARSAVESAKPGRSNFRKKLENDEDPEYESKEHGRLNGKDAKGKSARAHIDVLGEKNVDANELIKRCEDLQMLRTHIQTFEPDTQFRLRRVIKPPAYTVRWNARNDAMLLVGIYRHGLGNWTQIAHDKELGLADKMNVAGNAESKEGAPDTTKLSRRVTTLLRELEREVRPKVASRGSRKAVEAKKSSKGSQKKAAKSNKEASGSKAARVRSQPGPKKAKPARPDQSLGAMRTSLKTNNLETMKDLRALSREKNNMDSSEKIRRTKQCLLKLGRAIDKLAVSSPHNKAELWVFVHEVCRTNLAGERLQLIHEKISRASDDARD